MDDAAAGGHQIDLSGTNDLFKAEAVAVHHLAFDQPGEGLQADMRMRPDVQPLARTVIRGAGMIEKTPGTDHAPLTVGHGAADGEAFANFSRARLDALEHGLARTGGTVGGARAFALQRQIAHLQILSDVLAMTWA